MRKATMVIVGMLVAAAAWFMPASLAAASDEGGFAARINELRASKGLAPLAVHGELDVVAQRWAEQMHAAGRIAHNPNLRYEVTTPWAKLGENVGTGGDAGSVFDAFVRSPTHYRNLVDPDFTHIGIGTVTADGKIYTAHVFMRVAAAPAPPAPAPAPAPVAAPKAAPAPAPTPVAAPAPAPAAPAAPAAAIEPPAEDSHPILVPAMLEELRVLDASS